MTRMHQEIESLTPVLEKISNGSLLNNEETKVLNSVTEQMIRDSFDWIESEKKKQPQSALVLEQGLYTRFVNAYSAAREKNEKLRATNTDAIKTQLTALGAQVTEMKSAAPVASGVSGGLHTQNSVNTPGLENQKNSEVIKTIFNNLQTKINTPVTVKSLSEFLLPLANESNPDIRAVAASFVWSWLNKDGYVMSIGNNAIVLKNSNNLEQSVTLETTLNSHLSAKKINLSDFQGAIIAGTGKFSKYVEAVGVTPEQSSINKYAEHLMKILNIKLTNNKNQDTKNIESNGTALPEEKAFLISYVNGGYAGYNIVPDIKRSVELKKQNIELKSSVAYQTAETVIAAVGGPAAKAERAAIVKAGPEEELTIESVMNNPMRAISKYPWTALTLISASIWQFGFGKTIFGLFAGFLGIKAVKELGDTQLGKDLKKGIAQGAQEVVDATGEAAKKAKEAADNAKKDEKPKVNETTSLNPTQDAAKKKLEGMDDLKIKVSALSSTPKNAPFEKYIEFAQSLELQKLSVLVTPADQKHSIFNKDNSLDSSIQVPSNMDGSNLKRVIRAYLLGKDIPYSNLKDNNASWKDNKGSYNTDNTLGEAIKLTYGTVSSQQKTNNQSGNINEDTIKTFTFPGATVDVTKTVITNNGNDFQVKYAITSMPGITMDPRTQEVTIEYDNQGNLKTSNIAIKTGSSTRQKYSLTKNGNTIVLG